MAGPDYVGVRKRVVEYLRAELVGPVDGPEEETREAPTRRYSAGILYPRDSSFDEVEAEAVEDVSEETGDPASATSNEDQSDEPVEMANQRLPASFGLSFMVTGTPGVLVDLGAAAYEQEGGSGDRAAKGEAQRSRGWKRRRLAMPAEGQEVLLVPGPDGRTSSLLVLDGRARLEGVWRQSSTGWLVTVSLINERTGSAMEPPPPEDCLFQVEMWCRSADGKIVALPRTRLLTADEEEHELELLYRHQPPFANGHGCAAEWATADEGGSPAWVRTAIVPQHEVPAVTYEREGLGEVLRLAYLAESGTGEEAGDAEMVASLREFVGSYGSWIAGLPEENLDIPPHLSAVGERLLSRLKIALDRMSAGVDLLEDDPVVRRAFRLANRAMLLQMAHASEQYARKQRDVGTFEYTSPDLREWNHRRWRPFQLAFLLLTLPSIANGRDPDRRLVDLIWFPTGGGKTEAYLGVTAFLIFYRRLRYRDGGGGTAVLMRYTLRLLTAQQFRRAAGMIAACELMRRERPEELTEQRVSIGLWIGSGATENRYENALREYQELLLEPNPRSPYQIDSCPCCGTLLVPRRRSETAAHYGVDAGERYHRLRCPNETCPFHEQLPIAVVDDALYDDPPTLLLATVDKFADLPWRSEAGVFFGGEETRQPDLIIQDELHLISGPLGTMVGLYETALDGLISLRGDPPKVIASTATIRRSGPQAMGLYGRNVALFPPSGLSADDSWFARLDTSTPGRLYVGVLAPGLTGSTAYVRTSAALLQAPRDLELEGPERDAYWTLVSYFNSLRELGKAVTFAADDVPSRIKVIATDERRMREVGEAYEELTSNVPSRMLTELLTRLERSYDEKGQVSLLLCTNMLSVGVDIGRLALMLVAGQPKSTSEYIQATSRVGRDVVPGLVVCLYSPSKPRDRSHYERFDGYHAALYRGVEPTSVTPFTHEARERALHAVLVSLLRHGMGLENPTELELGSPELERWVRFVIDRVSAVDPRERPATEGQLRRLLDEWAERAAADSALTYVSDSPKNIGALLREYGKRKRRGWDTLRSMRNVDKNSLIDVLGSPQ